MSNNCCGSSFAPKSESSVFCWGRQAFELTCQSFQLHPMETHTSGQRWIQTTVSVVGSDPLVCIRRLICFLNLLMIPIMMLYDHDAHGLVQRSMFVKPPSQLVVHRGEEQRPPTAASDRQQLPLLAGSD